MAMKTTDLRFVVSRGICGVECSKMCDFGSQQPMLYEGYKRDCVVAVDFALGHLP